MAGISPSWIAVDPSGNLFLTSQGSICQVDPTGVFTTIANPLDYSGVGNDYIPATQTVFSGVFGLGWDPMARRLLISDGGIRLRQIFYTPPTTTTLIPSANPVHWNQSVTLTASVSPVDATGSVRFYYNYPYAASQGSWTYLGSAPVVNGTATFPWTAPTGDSTWALSAVYAGDFAHNLSQSATVSEVVQSGSASVTVTSSANPATPGQSVTFTATVTPADATGTVTFMNNGVTIGSSLISGGAATYTTSTLPSGANSITASYGGDTRYVGSTSAAFNETINKQTSTVTLIATANPVPFGQSLTFTATVSPSQATGTIQFSSDSTVLGTVNITNGTASFTTTTLPVGDHSIYADYSGDSTYAASNATPITQTISKAVTSVVLTVSPNPAAVGQAITLTATVAPNTATGLVQFFETPNYGQFGTVSVSNGSASVVISPDMYSFPVGTHTLIVNYNGDANNAFSTSSVVTLNVVKVPTTTTLAVAPNPSTYGNTVTLTAGVSPASATGSIQFFNSGTLLGSASVNSGQAQFSATGLPVGSNSLTAVYSGDTANAGSTSAAVTGAVNKAASSVTLTSSMNPAVVGQLVTFTAAVTPAGATGTVQFLDGSTAVGTGNVSGGAASLPISTLTVGTHSITAVYSGDAHFAGASSAALTQVANPAATPGFITTIAGTGVAGTAGTNGPSTAAQLNTPAGIAMDGTGNLLIADAGNNRVVRVDAVTGVLTLLAGNGAASSTGDGGPAASASLNVPFGIAVDAGNNLFVSELRGNRVRRIDATTGIITTFAGNGTASWSGDGGPATSASLNGPGGLAFDTAGNLYIADVNNDLVRRVAGQTGIITTVAGNGNTSNFTTPVPDGTPALYGYLSVPMWVSFDRSGNLLISETGSGSIQRVDAAGLLRNVAGIGASAFTGDGVPAVSSGFSQASNVVVDSAGNLYFADRQSGRVGRIDASTGVISTIAGNGTGTTGIGTCSTAANGDNGPATSATLDGVISVLLTPSGNLLLSDMADCRIRQVALPSPYVYTATNLTASATSIGQGQSVTVTATVLPIGASAVPTGAIQFVDAYSNSTVLGTATLSAGTASLTLSSLPLGFHNVVAYYSGDSQFNSSASPLASIRVQLPTAVTLTSSRNPVSAGYPVTLTATIPALPASNYSSEGNVSFMDGATLLGSAMVWNGSAQLSYTFGTPASHSLTAVFTGYDTYAGSTSAPLTETVLATTTTTLSVNNSTVTFGQPVQLTVSVLPATATGTVQFLDGTTPLGTAPLSNGTAAFTASTLATGSHSLTAVYSGDGANASSTSGAVSVAVSPVTSSIALSTSPNPSSPGQSITLTAAVSPSTATGTVQFFDGTTSLGTATISSGSGSLAVSSLTVGSHSVTAVYSGDTNTATSTSGAVTQTVNKAVSSVTLTASPNPSTMGQSVTVAATITPGAATGTVQFFDGSTSLGTATISSGAASFAVSNLTVGAHSLTAVYSGDTNNATSTSGAVTETVNTQASTTTLYSLTNPSSFGQAVIFKAIVTPTQATGTVQFLDGSTVLSSATIINGAAVLSVGTLAVGDHSISASYSGDANTASSTAAPLTQTVSKAPTSVALTESPNPATTLQGIFLTASVTPSTATGQVQFFDGATSLGSATLSGGVGSVVVYPTNYAFSVGTHSITAAYSGDATDALSTAPVLTLTVVKAPTTVSVTASANPATWPQAVTFTAAVSPAAATGSVQFTDGGTILGTANLSNGSAALTIPSLTPGTHSIVAVYSGNATYAAATSPSLSETVSQAASSTALAANPPSATVGQNVTFTAAVTPSGATGTVQFLDGSSVIATVPVTSGAAVFSTAALAYGAHSISAAYSGDANFKSSISAVVTEQVARLSTATTLTSGPNPSTFGTAVTLTAVVSPTAATGTVQFFNGSSLIGAATLAGGQAILSVVNLPAGALSLTAVYSGDATYAPGTSSAHVQTVHTAPSKTTLSADPPTQAAVGQTVTFTAAVTPALATGTVQFVDGNHTVLGTAAVSNGVAVFSTSSLAAGNYNITAQYPGGANVSSSHSSAMSYKVK